jgi:hypothetical protein
VQCTFAYLRHGEYILRLAINGEQWRESDQTVTVIPTLMIRDVEPQFVLARQPNQVLAVQVENLLEKVFVNAMQDNGLREPRQLQTWCTFEHSSPNMQPTVIPAGCAEDTNMDGIYNTWKDITDISSDKTRNELYACKTGHSSPGFFASEDLLICDVPNDLAGLGVGWVKLRVSVDGELRVKSQSFFMMRMTDRCPQGYHCTGGQAK